MQQVNIAIATAGLAVVLAGLISARLESLPFSKPLIALSIGVIAGPEILAWLTPKDWSHPHTIMKEAARMALAISVFGIAMRTPVQDYRRLLKPCVLLLTVGMGVMWLVSAGLAWALLGLSVALSLAVVAFAKVLGSDGILAAFAAGTAFNLGIDRSEEFEEQRVQETIGELFNLPVFVIFGAMLPWLAWAGLGVVGWGFSAGILALRRPLALLATGPWLGAGLQRRDIAFLGWFGPVGVAAIYYALHVLEQTENPAFWHVASLVVFVSIIAHGITSGPGLALYRRAEGKSTKRKTV